jgi:hypothetical protein
MGEEIRGRPLSRPQLELALGLRDQHLETSDDAAAG